MWTKVFAIAALATVPALAFGQSTMPVTKDGRRARTSMNATTDTANASANASVSTSASVSTNPSSSSYADTSAAVTGAQRSDTTQLGTGATAPTPTHSLQASGLDTASAGGQVSTPANSANPASPSDTSGANASVSSSTAPSASGSYTPAPVPQAAIQAQSDASLVGSPAWWQQHATADGKPKQ